MTGTEETCAQWRTGLLSSEHRLPVIAIADNTVRAANRAAAELFGELRAGAELRALFDEQACDKLAGLLAQARPFAVTELQVSGDGRLPTAMSFVALCGQGECLLIACTQGSAKIDDVSTKLMAANDQLVALARDMSRNMRDADAERQALRQLGNLRELFIAAMAHDLKSPLQAILFSEELLKQRAESLTGLDLEQHTGRVERQTKRMLFLIDSLLLAARLDSTAPGLPTEPVDLAAVARETVADLETHAQEARVEVHFASAGQTVVRGNRVWLGEVFANLIANAIRYSPPGSRIDVDVRRRGASVSGAVIDQGPGIPPSQRESVFERFVQHGERKGSVGLGLYVCRKVIELHGGRIWVDDTDRTGARFALELPALEG